MRLSELSNSLRRGGPATLNVPAVYHVAEGAVVAPARYAGRSGSEFVFETRYVSGEFRRTVLIDSKQSQSNRAEEGLIAARREGSSAAQIPVIEVRYQGRAPLSDLELPARCFDAHIRFATEEGRPVVACDWYRRLRDSTHADLSPLFLTAPAALAFGAWDSSRKSGQLRLRGLLVSELFGVVDDHEGRLSRRSGARLDPLGQDFNIGLSEFEQLLEVQREYLSPKLVEKLCKELADAHKKKSETISASGLNLGGIPPGVDSPFGVSVPEVRRARTYSLAGLRRLRFGGSAEEDVHARAALLAMLLLGAAYGDADPDLRAYCDVSAPQASTFLDDEPVELDLSIEACEAFLTEAIAALPGRLRWAGRVRHLVGDEALNRGAGDASDAND
jgi:CRISPR-associated protein Csb1